MRLLLILLLLFTSQISLSETKLSLATIDNYPPFRWVG